MAKQAPDPDERIVTGDPFTIVLLIGACLVLVVGLGGHLSGIPGSLTLIAGGLYYLDRST